METAGPRLTLAPVPTDDRTGLVRYPVPLDGVRVAVLQLPATLRPSDIERLVDFIVGLGLEGDPPWFVCQRIS